MTTQPLKAQDFTYNSLALNRFAKIPPIFMKTRNFSGEGEGVLQSSAKLHG
jgi:hypothetical protein